jgi:RNA polymerase sigma factor (sigma-70 family)
VWRIAQRVALDEREQSMRLLLGETTEIGLVEPARDPELSEALMLLPPRRRLMFFLRYFADLSYQDIAALCDVSEGTVAASLAQGRSTVMQALREPEAMGEEVTP